MENASKALIIAGAILLSILIIGLGMFIYQQASGALTDTGIDEQKANAFNSKFTNYSGIITGTQARNLCDVVMSHNRSASDFSEWVAITDCADEAAFNNVLNNTTNGLAAEPDGGVVDFNRTISNTRTGIHAGWTYKVDFAYSDDSGYVVQIALLRQNTEH